MSIHAAVHSALCIMHMTLQATIQIQTNNVRLPCVNVNTTNSTVLHNTAYNTDMRDRRSQECATVHSASYIVVRFDSAPFIAGKVHSRNV